MISDFNTINGSDYTFSWFRPLLTTRDHAHFGHSLRKEQSTLINPKGTCALMVDVYEIGPAKLLDEMLNRMVSECFVITQIFPTEGVAGVHFMTSPYYFLSDGKVVQRPGDQSPQYEPTSNPTWWVEQTAYSNATDSITWAHVTTVSDYHVFRVGLQYGKVLFSENQPVRTKPCLLHEYVPETWMPTAVAGAINAILPDNMRELLVPPLYRKVVAKKVVDEISLANMSRTRSQFNYSTMSKDVSSRMATGEYAVLRDFVPMVDWVALATNTLDCALARDLPNQKKSLSGVLTWYDSTLRFFRKERVDMLSSEVQDNSMVWAGAKVTTASFFLLILYFISRRRFLLARKATTAISAYRQVQGTVDIPKLCQKAVSLVPGAIATMGQKLARVSSFLRSEIPVAVSEGIGAKIEFLVPGGPEIPSHTVETFVILHVAMMFVTMAAPPIYEETIKGWVARAIRYCTGASEAVSEIPFNIAFSLLETSQQLTESSYFTASPVLFIASKFLQHYGPYWSGSRRATHMLQNGIIIATHLGTFTRDNSKLLGYTSVAGICLSIAALPFISKRGLLCAAVTTAVWEMLLTPQEQDPLKVGSANLGLTWWMLILVLLGMALDWYWRRPPSIPRTGGKRDNETPCSKWEVFKETHRNMEKYEDDDYYHCSVPIEDANLYEQTQIPSTAKLSALPADWPEPQEARCTQFILCCTNAAMQKPTGPAMCGLAIQERLFCHVPNDDTCYKYDPKTFQITAKCEFKKPLEDCPLAPEWDKAYDIFAKAYPDVALSDKDFKFTHDDWIKNMGGAVKKNRARKAVAEAAEGHPTRPVVTVHMKGDEVLYPRPYPKGGLWIKPRPISAVDPSIQADCGVPIHKATKVFKRNIGLKNPWKIGKWEVCFKMGSGLLSDELDAWYADSLEWVGQRTYRLSVIIAGDDLFYFERGGDEVIIFGESDFEKFDRTEGVHAIGYEFKVLVLLKMLAKHIRRLKTCYGKPIVVQFMRLDDYRAKIAIKMVRLTGGPDTTLGNSLVNQGSILHALYEADKRDLSFSDVLSSCQLKLGLLAKLQRGTTNATFLKGWWVPAAIPGTAGFMLDGTKRWLPLPSQSVKAGKVLTNPKYIFRGNDEVENRKRMAYGVAKGYGSVPDNYPIFGALLAAYKNAPTDKSFVLPVDVQFVEEHKTKVVGDYEVHVPSALAMMEERYGISSAELEACDEFVRRSCVVPGFLCHRVFDIMAARDYG